MDHILLSPALAPRLVNAGVDRQVRSWEKTSDHAPAWVELKRERAGATRSNSSRVRPALARSSRVRSSCAVLAPAHAEALLHVAAFAWIIAFAGFALAFGPLLLGLKLRALAVRRPGAAQPVL